MPNWVYNRLAVTGSPAAIGRFVDRMKPSEDASERDEVLDFEGAVPMPDELRESTEVDPSDPHGLPRWFTWSLASWGTKWNAWYSTIEGDPDDGNVTYSFQTAWSPPDRWLARSSEAFPSLDLHHEYVEEMGHFAGRGRWLGGALLEHAALEPGEMEWIEEVEAE